jgi:hypothetical protein
MGSTGINTTIAEVSGNVAPGVTGTLSVKGKADAAIGLGFVGVASSYDPEKGVWSVSAAASGGIATVTFGWGVFGLSAGSGTIVGAKFNTVTIYLMHLIHNWDSWINYPRKSCYTPSK